MQVRDNVLKNNYDLVNTKAFQTMATYNYWRGWWNEPPRNVVERFQALRLSENKRDFREK